MISDETCKDMIAFPAQLFHQFMQLPTPVTQSPGDFPAPQVVVYIKRGGMIGGWDYFEHS
jgi:hypothetical protein